MINTNERNQCFENDGTIESCTCFCFLSEEIIKGLREKKLKMLNSNVYYIMNFKVYICIQLLDLVNIFLIKMKFFIFS